MMNLAKICLLHIKISHFSLKSDIIHVPQMYEIHKKKYSSVRILHKQDYAKSFPR